MNDWILAFSERFQYADSEEGISFGILISSDRSIHFPINAKLDTGSTFCVFQRRYAELLGLDVESGAPQRIRTTTGSFTAYGHEVTMTVGGLEWQAVVYFAEDENFPVSVVGRAGFLDRLRVGLVD
ncbi:MAG TPA: retropepsin-like aspartic protease [Blastocatellia bacterium]|nr:retropepsin-like aspartic protease [Blastocatellia bacterium]